MVDSPPIVKIVLGLLALFAGIQGISKPRSWFPEDSKVRSGRESIWGRLWNKWLDRGYFIVLFIVPGGALVIDGAIGLLAGP